MNRGVVVGTVLALVVGGVVLYLTRLRDVPAEVEEAPVVAEATPPPPAPAPEPEPEPSPAPPPELGVLRVESDVDGAQVFLDRQFIGTTPAMIENVEVGGHQLNVSAEGFDAFAETIDVEPGPRDIYVRFREVRLDLGIDVIHDHRFGSCEGQLVATVDGIRYETDNENDGFAVPLDGLGAFEVDYLEATLTIEVRNGRTYNFTEPDGDADRLFVFHRDVEEARVRLAQGFAPVPAGP